MIRIIFGNRKDNIFYKIRKSHIARILFVIILVYLYESCGNLSKMHIKEVISIAVLGLGLLNLLYMPYRFMNVDAVSKKQKVFFVITACVFGIACIIKLKEGVVHYILEIIWSGILISFGVTLVVALFGKDKKERDKSRKNYRKKTYHYDEMDGHDFEYFCADVLERNGYYNVEVTRGSGDFGIDIIAYKDDIRYGIQCKRYAKTVGWRAVEEANAGAEYWDCDKAVVLTNSYFTKQAKEGAMKIGVDLLDRDWLEEHLR